MFSVSNLKGFVCFTDKTPQLGIMFSDNVLGSDGDPPKNLILSSFESL